MSDEIIAIDPDAVEEQIGKISAYIDSFNSPLPGVEGAGDAAALIEADRCACGRINAMSERYQDCLKTFVVDEIQRIADTFGEADRALARTEIRGC